MVRQILIRRFKWVPDPKKPDEKKKVYEYFRCRLSDGVSSSHRMVTSERW